MCSKLIIIYRLVVLIIYQQKMIAQDSFDEIISVWKLFEYFRTKSYYKFSLEQHLKFHFFNAFKLNNFLILFSNKSSSAILFKQLELFELKFFNFFLYKIFILNLLELFMMKSVKYFWVSLKFSMFWTICSFYQKIINSQITDWISDQIPLF